MSKAANRKSQAKQFENGQSFVKNNASFHEARDEDQATKTNPDLSAEEYENFRRAQGDFWDSDHQPDQQAELDLEKDQIDEREFEGEPTVAPMRHTSTSVLATTLLRNAYTLIRYPYRSVQRIIKASRTDHA